MMDMGTIEYELQGHRVLEKDRTTIFQRSVDAEAQEKPYFTAVSTITSECVPSTPGLLVSVAEPFVTFSVPSRAITNTAAKLASDRLRLGFLSGSYSIFDDFLKYQANGMIEWITGSVVLSTSLDDRGAVELEEVHQSFNDSSVLLESKYQVKIPEIQLIQEYLNEHSDMEEVVTLAAKSAREEFDNDTEISLEMYYDIDSEEQNLTLYVRQENYEEDIIKKIDMICDIYEPLLEDKSDWFLVTTDFQPPKHK